MAKQQVLEFFHRIKNEVEDILDESPNSVLAKIYTDILYDKGIITDYELLFFEKEINNKTIKINIIPQRRERDDDHSNKKKWY